MRDETLGIVERGIIWQSAESYWTLIGIIVVAEMWRATSIMMIILVAGLQSIPDEYLEAAEVYGATLWQRVRRVILPMLRPSLQVALILRIILAIQIFATAVALAGTGLTVMSAETLDGFDAWREPERILGLCRLAVGPRPGAEPLDASWVTAHYPGREDRFAFLAGP